MNFLERGQTALIASQNKAGWVESNHFSYRGKPLFKRKP